LGFTGWTSSSCLNWDGDGDISQ